MAGEEETVPTIARGESSDPAHAHAQTGSGADVATQSSTAPAASEPALQVIVLVRQFRFLDHLKISCTPVTCISVPPLLFPLALSFVRLPNFFFSFFP